MHRIDQRKRRLTDGIFSLWRNWAISVGSMAAIVILSPLVSSKLIPLSALLLAFGLGYLDRRNRKSESPDCFRIPHIIFLSLFLTAIAVLVAIVLLSRDNVYEWSGQPANPDNPSITALILAPITTAIAAFYMIRNTAVGFCRRCQLRNGNSIDRGLMGEIYYKESVYQNRMLFWISLTISIVSWVYYCTNYINVNINRTDTFFFNYFPAIIYILSLIYVGGRCYSMWTYYCKNDNLSKTVGRNGTVVRFIIIHEDKIYLTIPAVKEVKPDNEANLIDTPAKISLPFREKVHDHEVAAMFKEAFGMIPGEIRFIYESHDYSAFNNVFHYCVFADDESMTQDDLGGDWFTYGQVRQMIGAGVVAPAFVAELKRIYTVAMAWKTYDENGFRRYDIKHYKPTFRFRDLKSWDVDFNDNNWIFVSMINQDCIFFRIRRWWNKRIKGFLA